MLGFCEFSNVSRNEFAKFWSTAENSPCSYTTSQTKANYTLLLASGSDGIITITRTKCSLFMMDFGIGWLKRVQNRLFADKKSERRFSYTRPMGIEMKERWNSHAVCDYREIILITTKLFKKTMYRATDFNWYMENPEKQENERLMLLVMVGRRSEINFWEERKE
jgi:hypothetical protein